MREFFILILFFMVPAVAFSATIYVPDHYPKIQDAMDASNSGDTVIVRPGTYVENIDFKGKAVTLQSELGPEVTVIDGSLSGSVVVFVSNEGPGSVLDGFTVTNGSGFYLRPYYFGGGIFCDRSAPVIRNNKIMKNAVSESGVMAGFGGGIGLNAASPEITGNLITENRGQLSLGGGIALLHSMPSIHDNTIVQNHADFSGGGIYCGASSSLAVIEGNTISNNTASTVGAGTGGSGGGIACEDSSPTIRNNTIAKNVVVKGGGGAMSLFHSSPIVAGNTIADNQSLYCGAIVCTSGSPSITNNWILNNATEFSGGGIRWGFDSFPSVIGNVISGNTAGTSNLHDGDGGAIYMDGLIPPTINIKFIQNMDRPTEAVISGNLISGNTADNGGGINCFYHSSPIISSNMIIGNRAGKAGGGIHCYGLSSPPLTNNIIAKNEAGTCGGGAALAHCSSIMTNNTITGNTSVAMGGGMFCAHNSWVNIANTILWDNTAPQGSEMDVLWSSNPSTVVISFSDVKGGQAQVHVDPGCTLFWGPGMIDADPLFVAPPEGDFHLRYTSPCREKGDNVAMNIPAEDFEGDPRIVFMAADMGADEFHTHLYCTGDTTPGGKINVKIVGLPGTLPVGLCIGSGVLDPPYPSIWGDWYLAFPIMGPVDLGMIPAPDGVLVLPGKIPGSSPAPCGIPLQALVGANLTNLWELDVK